MTARSRDHGNGNGNGSTEASRQGSPYRPGQERESAQHNQLQQSASSSTPPSRSGHSPARQSQSGHNAQPPPAGGRTIAGEPLHDMGRAISLLKSSKFYAEGFLMKKVEAGPDGKPVRRPAALDRAHAADLPSTVARSRTPTTSGPSGSSSSRAR